MLPVADMAWMTGAHSEMKEVDTSDMMYMNVASHGAPTQWTALDKHNPSMPRLFGDVAPSSQMFSEGNGGESRKSFHGYPDGFAQLIESPETWTITPMQIDTRNRNCGVTPADVKNCTSMSPDYEPRSARYGRDWQGVAKPALKSNYSGILECPCNSRYGGPLHTHACKCAPEQGCAVPCVWMCSALRVDVQCPACVYVAPS